MTKKINKLLKVNLLQIGAKQPRYRVTIEDMDKNEVLYRVESFAGVVASMESQPELHQELSMQGVPDIAVVATMQKLAWGHPLLALTCLDQLKEAIRPRLNEIRKFVSETMSENANRDNTKNGSSEKPNTPKNSTNGLES